VCVCVCVCVSGSIKFQGSCPQSCPFEDNLSLWPDGSGKACLPFALQKWPTAQDRLGWRMGGGASPECLEEWAIHPGHMAVWAGRLETLACALHTG
jgi:hypothetical protein